MYFVIKKESLDKLVQCQKIRTVRIISFERPITWTHVFEIEYTYVKSQSFMNNSKKSKRNIITCLLEICRILSFPFLY